VFDYEIDPAKAITGEGGPIDDSAGIAKFTATIPSDGSARFTQVIFVRAIPEPSSAAILLLGCMLAVVGRADRGRWRR
jgi:hypothetical protein